METEKLVVNGVTYVREDLINPILEDKMEAVLIRSNASGVHYGYLKEVKDTLAGRVVTLVKSRRIWSWKGAASLSQIAVDGVGYGSKITVEVAKIEVVDVIEIIPLTQKAFDNLNRIEIWKIK